jgi:hypothetical protein
MDLIHTVREAPRYGQGGSNIRYMRMVIGGREIPKMGGHQLVGDPLASRFSLVFPFVFPIVFFSRTRD